MVIKGQLEILSDKDELRKTLKPMDGFGEIALLY
jgi:hypothetical protein